MTTNNTIFLIIWGMHRSGTSLLASAMRVFGAEAGDNLLAADAFNSQGYFEDKELMNLNAAMLNHLQMSWDSLSPVTPHDINSLLSAGFLNNCVAFLNAVAQRGPVVTLKDPRMTRLAPFWKIAFRRAGVIPHGIIVYRNPAAVIQSLRKRALAQIRPSLVLDPQYAALLWLGYTLASLLYTSTCPRALIKYEDFLHNPGAALEQLAAILKLQPDCRMLQEFCEKSVDADLNHADRKLDIHLPPRVAELAALLDSMTDMRCPDKKEIGAMWPDNEDALLLARLLDQAGARQREISRELFDLKSRLNIP